MGILFVTGIHGVGKTTLCDFLSQKLKIPALTASKLIQKERSLDDSPAKLNSEIDLNAVLFQKAVKRLAVSNDSFIIDGHTVLLGGSGQRHRVKSEIFSGLPITCFLLLLESIQTIDSRLKSSGKLDLTIEEIELFQNEEILYTLEIVERLKCSLVVVTSSEETDRIYTRVQKVFS